MKRDKKIVSKTMKAIKSKWTKPEKEIHNFLIKQKINHKMHPDMFAHPDILIKDKHLIIFYNSCFWHKCSKCWKDLSKLNLYRKKRLITNYQRDKKNYRKLKKDGWNVLIIWGHDMKDNKYEKLIKEV